MYHGKTGKTLAQQLKKAGIDTPEKLKEMGMPRGFLRLKADDPTACLSKPSVIEGATEGVRWRVIPNPQRRKRN